MYAKVLVVQELYLTQGLEMRPAGTEDEGSWAAWWGARGHVTRFGKINHYSYNVKNEGAG